jgi:hypothetical protein
MIEERQLRGRKGVNYINANVEARGLRIIVKAMPFVSCKKEYELTEDFEFLVEPERDEVLYVCGYLAEERNSGDIVVIVSETRAHEAPYCFGESSPYLLLHEVFFVVVPPNAHTLDEVPIRVKKLLPAEEI